MISWFTLLLLLPLVSTLPLERSIHTACGKFDTITSGSYSLLTNHWGESTAVSGSQCSTLESVNDRTATWLTHWTWIGDNGIKSFSNVQLNEGVNRQLSSISSMPSTWHWSQHSSGRVVADVAYDFFTSYSPGGSHVNEVMIWLANFNAGPLSYEFNSDGKPVPIAANLHIVGHSWNLYSGSNDYNPVYSFLPTGDNITSFSGDIYTFFTYLIDNGHVTSSQYLVTAQAGTEATCGSATFHTSAFRLTIN